MFFIILATFLWFVVMNYSTLHKWCQYYFDFLEQLYFIQKSIVYFSELSEKAIKAVQVSTESVINYVIDYKRKVVFRFQSIVIKLFSFLKIIFYTYWSKLRSVYRTFHRACSELQNNNGFTTTDIEKFKELLWKDGPPIAAAIGGYFII